ncbi:hypothetical protein ACX0GZ_10635 [Sphingomonas aestuarii]
MFALPDHRAAKTLWTRQFESDADVQAVLDAVSSDSVDLMFFGHLTLVLGTADLDGIVDSIITDARDERRAQAEEAAEYARDHETVELLTAQKRRGFSLKLCRKSETVADWEVVYDRAAERDRLCDWLRWQRARFLQFLEFAAEHGDEALTRLLTDEMFETERLVKKQGRSAGGVRPLRMWRGEP